mmetsp:Transcript_25766/g.68486  ORF Transcript_25766/g.68486 Transcript_25766/m.68486 type:complete len:96 (+) Transcript_25766:60-347(+)
MHLVAAARVFFAHTASFKEQVCLLCASPWCGIEVFLRLANVQRFQWKASGNRNDHNVFSWCCQVQALVWFARCIVVAKQAWWLQREQQLEVCDQL